MLVCLEKQIRFCSHVIQFTATLCSWHTFPFYDVTVTYLQKDFSLLLLSQEVEVQVYSPAHFCKISRTYWKQKRWSGYYNDQWEDLTLKLSKTLYQINIKNKKFYEILKDINWRCSLSAPGSSLTPHLRVGVRSGAVPCWAATVWRPKVSSGWQSPTRSSLIGSLCKSLRQQIMSSVTRHIHQCWAGAAIGIASIGFYTSNCVYQVIFSARLRRWPQYFRSPFCVFVIRILCMKTNYNVLPKCEDSS